MENYCREIPGMKKKLILIAPLPPPITGQSVVSEYLLKKLDENFDIISINYGRKDAVSSSGLNLAFIKKVLNLGKLIKKNKNDTDIVYFTISQSIPGNLKDLYLLYKMGKKLRQRCIIHLHGGYFDKLFDKLFFPIRLINRLLFQDIKSGIVLGNSLIKCLLPLMDQSRISVIENFFKNEIRISEMELKTKWQNPDLIKILFLSNMMKSKGYQELLDAFTGLDDDTRMKFHLSFAGEFDSRKDKDAFLKTISEFQNISYNGTVSGIEKIKLLHESHALFLPTYYHIEGQPVSILESYASGLAVFTTDQGGIKDIFTDNTNGISIQKQSKKAIYDILKDFHNYKDKYKIFAYYNHSYSELFSENIFLDKIKKLFDF
jgi:glycosyltransferase involved in cell wall biosynthesis